MSRHIDYAFKSYVLNQHNDLLKKQKQCSLYDFAINNIRENGVISPVLRMTDKYNQGCMSFALECAENGLSREYLEACKINKAMFQRTKRLKERIKQLLLNGDCLFITLTFNDKTLAKTSYQERRVAITRYLKSFNACYVANVDYGKLNHREHYHAILQCSCIDFTAWRKYGNINAERVRNRDINIDKTKLAKYIAKLSNHAIKETTKRSSLIYSR